jgi:hypothetical protein
MIVFAETAIWLLGKDKTLGTKKEINGMTCLHLLAKMPSAFRSSCNMGKVKRLLYHCMSLATTLFMLCYVCAFHNSINYMHLSLASFTLNKVFLLCFKHPIQI